MIKKNIIMSTLITSLVTTSLFSAPVFAAESNSTTSTSKKVETSSLSKSNKISQALINKATPYITVKDNKYSLSKEGYSTLNSNEIKIVLDCINNSNTALNKAFKTKSLTKNGNAFVQKVSKKSTKSIIALNYSDDDDSQSQDVYITYYWWGDSLYFSHQAISDYADYIELGGAAVTLGSQSTTISDFVAQYGIDLASTAVTDISLATSLLVWDMSKVDQGNGVYLNFYADIIPVTVTPA